MREVLLLLLLEPCLVAAVVRLCQPEILRPPDRKSPPLVQAEER
jgi:hypothetical protein